MTYTPSLFRGAILVYIYVRGFAQKDIITTARNSGTRQ